MIRVSKKENLLCQPRNDYKIKGMFYKKEVLNANTFNKVNDSKLENFI